MMRCSQKTDWNHHVCSRIERDDHLWEVGQNTRFARNQAVILDSIEPTEFKTWALMAFWRILEKTSTSILLVCKLMEMTLPHTLIHSSLKVSIQTNKHFLSLPRLIVKTWALLMALRRLLEETSTSRSFANWWRWPCYIHSKFMRTLFNRSVKDL